MTLSKQARDINIAVLDDDQAVLRLIGAFLTSDFGDRVRLSLHDSPQKAREFLEGEACDILISDIEMPGIDGLEMLEFAKKRNAWTQVIFMTGHSSWDRISSAVEKGASDYLVKPVDRKELTSIVEGQIERLDRWKRAVIGTLRSPELAGV